MPSRQRHLLLPLGSAGLPEREEGRAVEVAGQDTGHRTGATGQRGRTSLPPPFGGRGGIQRLERGDVEDVLGDGGEHGLTQAAVVPLVM